MTRAEAITKGLVVAAREDYERNECLRKVPYAGFCEAFVVARRLAARSNQDGKRLRVYCCRFCKRLHIGNYSPSFRTFPAEIVKLQTEVKNHLGRISALENDLSQCKYSRNKLKSEIGQLKSAKTSWLHKFANKFRRKQIENHN